jgi:hypothetical protein
MNATVRNDPSTRLRAIRMSEHDRRQAERHMHAAEKMVDVIFAGVNAVQTLVRRLRRLRRLRGLRVAH